MPVHGTLQLILKTPDFKKMGWYLLNSVVPQMKVGGAMGRLGEFKPGSYLYTVGSRKKVEVSEEGVAQVPFYLLKRCVTLSKMLNFRPQFPHQQDQGPRACLIGCCVDCTNVREEHRTVFGHFTTCSLSSPMLLTCTL